MKYVYILGLEHSGTTLINHLISQNRNAIGLGEVAQFFSPKHMDNYIRKWGKYDVVRQCSCGRAWGDCQFWGELVQLNGLNSKIDLLEKYEKLIAYVRTSMTENTVIVDSSKGLHALRTLIDLYCQGYLKKNELHVVMMIKDVRSFTASMNRKSGSDCSVLSNLRTFNWWFGEYKNMMVFLDKHQVSNIQVLYEKFCMAPLIELERLFAFLGFDLPAELFHDYGNSHLVLGNKDYILKNRNEIKYDNEWFIQDKIHVAYLLHRKARLFNALLYE